MIGRFGFLERTRATWKASAKKSCERFIVSAHLRGLDLYSQTADTEKPAERIKSSEVRMRALHLAARQVAVSSQAPST